MSFMDTLALPSEMTKRDHWIVWKVDTRNGKETKIPISPHTRQFGKTDDPQTWATYEKASKLVNKKPQKYGLGFVFTEDDPIVGIDLDHVREPETGRVTDERAKDIINTLDSYTEISPSGDGYHVIVKGRMPSGRNRKGEIEMYDSGRFFTVTGNRVPGTEPEVKNRDSPLRVIHNEYLRESMTQQTQSTTNVGDPEIELDDNEVLKKAKNSKSGKKFEALWNGITSGYDSHSEADLALCSYLAFWTGGDKNQMDDLFRKSGLMRPKWDNQHASDGDTYGDLTIQKAIRTSDSFYGQN